MGTEEEEFAQQLAETIETNLDIEDIELADEGTTVRVTLANGDRFRVRVRKIEDDD